MPLKRSMEIIRTRKKKKLNAPSRSWCSNKAPKNWGLFRLWEAQAEPKKAGAYLYNGTKLRKRKRTRRLSLSDRREEEEKEEDDIPEMEPVNWTSRDLGRHSRHRSRRPLPSHWERNFPFYSFRCSFNLFSDSAIRLFLRLKSAIFC